MNMLVTDDGNTAAYDVRCNAANRAYYTDLEINAEFDIDSSSRIENLCRTSPMQTLVHPMA
jgi:hypothetical protein